MTSHAALSIVAQALSLALTLPESAQSQTAVLSAPSSVRAVLFARLKRDVLSNPWKLSFDSSTVRIHGDTSRIVPRGRYYWATYFPPGTADVMYSARAIALDSAVRILDTPDDWLAVVRTGSWKPGSEHEAVAACAELIAYASPRSPAYRRSLAYLSRESLEGLSAYERSRLARIHLTAPEVLTEPGAQWVVRLWAIEPSRSTRYACRPVAPTHPLTATDSVGVGLLTLGP